MVKNRKPRALAAALAVLALAVVAGRALGHIDGMVGYTQSATGCSCHGSSPNGNGPVLVTLSGPQSVQPGSTHNYTLTVSGGPASTTGGFDLKATAGTLVPGPGTYLASGELTHLDNPQRSWTFDWTAPVADGSASFYAVALASNGAGSSGDSWNFYGNAVNTPFTIQVSSLVGVDPRGGAVLELSSPVPSPTRGGTTISYALPAAGPATLAVYDAAGRRVATLAAGAATAGRHAATWDGRTDRGGDAGAGLFFVRLDAAGDRRTVRLLRLR